MTLPFCAGSNSPGRRLSGLKNKFEIFRFWACLFMCSRVISTHIKRRRENT
nr:MAG TPA: hypothetical protein [Caudoviricetes sp.]